MQAVRYPISFIRFRKSFFRKGLVLSFKATFIRSEGFSAAVKKSPHDGQNLVVYGYLAETGPILCFCDIQVTFVKMDIGPGQLKELVGPHTRIEQYKQYLIVEKGLSKNTIYSYLRDLIAFSNFIGEEYEINQIENINAQNDKKNNKNIVIINKDKCKSYNIVKSKNKKNENIITIIITITIMILMITI